MHKVIITSLSPGELFRAALTRARTASAAIERLKDAPLAPGETLHDRTLAVTVHAHELAEAFAIIDALSDACEAHPEAFIEEDDTNHVSPPSPTDAPSGHRGVHREDDPNAN